MINYLSSHMIESPYMGRDKQSRHDNPRQLLVAHQHMRLRRLWSHKYGYNMIQEQMGVIKCYKLPHFKFGRIPIFGPQHALQT